jgi:hypothetical protein
MAAYLARVHLVHGDWLRREQQRVELREHLRAAHDIFGRFAPRRSPNGARRKLQATGETVRKRTVDTREASLCRRCRPPGRPPRATLNLRSAR